VYLWGRCLITQRPRDPYGGKEEGAVVGAGCGRQRTRGSRLQRRLTFVADGWVVRSVGSGRCDRQHSIVASSIQFNSSRNGLEVYLVHVLIKCTLKNASETPATPPSSSCCASKGEAPTVHVSRIGSLVRLKHWPMAACTQPPQVEMQAPL
jgi:hypothetical protein